MATPTYTPIASITLGSSASSVTFSSIPQDYRDLVLVALSATSTDNNSDLDFRANGDTGNNYTSVVMKGAVSGGAGSFVSTSNRGVTGFMNDECLSIIQFMDYSATDKHKTVLCRGNQVSLETRANAVRYASTTAITSISLGSFASGFDLAAGSKFSLWGIAS